MSILKERFLSLFFSLRILFFVDEHIKNTQRFEISFVGIGWKRLFFYYFFILLFFFGQRVGSLLFIVLLIVDMNKLFIFYWKKEQMLILQLR